MTPSAQHGDERRGLDRADDAHDRIADRDLDGAGGGS
jgi:hypothetical protein